MKNVVAWCLLSLLLPLVGCAEAVVPSSRANILALGDSMLAWNAPSRGRISDRIENLMGVPVVDRSTIGARFNYALPITGAMGLNISKQYVAGNWEWVILNGGGNDLFFGCGCVSCGMTIDKIISKDGRTGKIPALISKIRSQGARAIYVGYLHSPGVASLIERCKSDDLELEGRIEQLALRIKDFFYIRNSEITPVGDRSMHSIDMIHPSAKGSNAIAERIVEIITAETE